MSHIPVNHPLRSFYRVLTALAGIYVLVFGVLGVIEAGGSPFFHRGDVSVLGLRTNLAFAIASIITGGLICAAVVVGRNLDATVAVFGGVVFMLAGTFMMLVLDSDLNVLNFSMATVIVSLILGIVLFTAGLYVRSGAPKTA